MNKKMTPKAAYDKLYWWNFGSNNMAYSKKDLEEIIAKNLEYSCLYAEYTEKRFALGEQNIINHKFRKNYDKHTKVNKTSYYAYKYALNVIKDRWHEAEDVILSDAYSAYLYCKDVVKDRVESIEKDIVICEEVIFGDESCTFLAALYARDVIKGRWKELEDNILQNKKCSGKVLKYCKIINERWPEAEHLLTDNHKTEYYMHFNMALPEEDYNKQIMQSAFNNKKSKYLEKINRDKKIVKSKLSDLIQKGFLSKDQTIDEVIKSL